MIPARPRSFLASVAGAALAALLAACSPSVPDTMKIGVLTPQTGVFALRGLVGWARHQRYPPRVLHLATSADSGAPADRVVGYPAFAFG